MLPALKSVVYFFFAHPLFKCSQNIGCKEFGEEPSHFRLRWIQIFLFNCKLLTQHLFFFAFNRRPQRSLNTTKKKTDIKKKQTLEAIQGNAPQWPLWYDFVQKGGSLDFTSMVYWCMVFLKKVWKFAKPKIFNLSRFFASQKKFEQHFRPSLFLSNHKKNLLFK